MTIQSKSSFDQILSETALKASKILKETFSTPKEREDNKINLAIMEEKIAVQDLLKKQKTFFDTGVTLDIDFRINQLKKLYSAIMANQKEIENALRGDLFKSKFDSYATETGLCLKSIRYTIKHLKKWARPQLRGLEAESFPSLSFVYPEPYGTVLIIAPWNYPFLLSMQPLIHAMAAGNTCVIKTSCQSPETSSLIKKIISQTFDYQYIAVHDGGHIGNEAVLNQKYDFIFFTGSPQVGQRVMQTAATSLTPIVLELWGKNPCIVDKNSDIEVSARRIIWGKLLNAGQSCTAPDYLIVHKDIKDVLIEELTRQIEVQYGKNPVKDDDYPKIINEEHFRRIMELCPDAECNEVSNKIAPVIKYLGPLGEEGSESSPLMNTEIFGPVLPVVDYENFDDVVKYINKKPCPMSLYLFSRDKENQYKAVHQIRYGCGCLNDCMMQALSDKIPFGGLGISGNGNYHGKYGFDTFTHYKGVLKRSFIFDSKIRYAPHMDSVKALKTLLK